MGVFLFAFSSQRWVLDLPLTAIDTIPTLAAARTESWTEIFDVLLRELRGDATGGHYYRPLTLASYTLDQWIHGGTAFGYHLTDVVLHGLATVAVFWMVRLAVDLPRVASFFAALLFLLHPAVIEVVPAIARRQEPLLVIGFCLAVIGGRYLPLRVGWLLMALGSLIAVTAVERGLAVPGVVLGYLFFYRFAGSRPRRRVIESLRWTLPPLAIAVGFLSFHVWLHGANGAELRPQSVLPVGLQFAIQLLYPQQVFDIVAPSSTVSALAYLGVAALGGLAFGIPLLRSNRRGVVWFALVWIGCYQLLMGLVGIMNPWYVYTAVPGLSLLVVFFALEAYRLFLATPSRRIRAVMATSAGALMVAAVVVGSPSLREYRGWRVASELSESFLAELASLSERLPARTPVVILNLPGHFRESDSDYMVTRSAAILWPSSVEVWKEEQGIDMELTLLGCSDFVADTTVPEVEIDDEEVRVYFVDGRSRYTNANSAWPGARRLPESVGRGYAFPLPHRQAALETVRFLVFDGQRLVPLEQLRG